MKKAERRLAYNDAFRKEDTIMGYYYHEIAFMGGDAASEAAKSFCGAMDADDFEDQPSEVPARAGTTVCLYASGNRPDFDTMFDRLVELATGGVEIEWLAYMSSEDTRTYAVWFSEERGRVVLDSDLFCLEFEEAVAIAGTCKGDARALDALARLFAECEMPGGHSYEDDYRAMSLATALAESPGLATLRIDPEVALGWTKRIEALDAADDEYLMIGEDARAELQSVIEKAVKPAKKRKG